MKTTTKTAVRTRLPNKLSALLRLAVKDSVAAEGSRKYFLDMGAWVMPGSLDRNDREGCAVCMAGACMVGALGLRPRAKGLSPGAEVNRGRITWKDRERLLAINTLRDGSLNAALDHLHRSMLGVDRYRPPSALERRAMKQAASTIAAAYDHGNARATWPAYRTAANILESAGL
jgi:hypothetical protein